MDKIALVYHYLQLHPLLWQTPLSLITTSGAFQYLKRRIALEGKAKVTALITAVSIATVLIHAAIVGLAFAGPLGFLKITGEQTLLYIGGLTLAYNFLTVKVEKFLKDAKAIADASNSDPTTPSQKNQAASEAGSAVAAGVAQF